MGRVLGVRNRNGHDSWVFLQAFVKRARRNRKCCRCNRVASRAILGSSAKYPLSTLMKESGMTLRGLKEAIRASGWWCRSCQSKELTSDAVTAPKKRKSRSTGRPGWDCPPIGWNTDG